MTSQHGLKELPRETVRLLGSSQVITSVYSVVKELTENSIDAGAGTIDLKLENFGLDKIELRDNGEGIASSDIPFVAQRHHTSKISKFSDLENLSTYGFRGEALGSLCAVSSLSITSKTANDQVSVTYSFNYKGQITESRPSHLGQGTTITAINLFKNLPVRRQFYNSTKKKKEELKRVEELFMAFGIICPEVRFTLRHNRELIWQKNPVPNLKSSVLGVLGRNIYNNLEYKCAEDIDTKMIMEMYLPKPDGDSQVVSRSANDRGFIFVNKRPVVIKDLEKIIKQYSDKETGRYPVFVIAVILPPSELDVNLDPNKTQVFLQHKEVVMDSLRSVLEDLYGPPVRKDVTGSVKLLVNELKEDQQDISGDADDTNGNIPSNNNQCEKKDHHLVTNISTSLENNVTKISPAQNLGDSDLPVFKVTMYESNQDNSISHKDTNCISDRQEVSVTDNATVKMSDSFINVRDNSVHSDGGNDSRRAENQISNIQSESLITSCISDSKQQNIESVQNQNCPQVSLADTDNSDVEAIPQSQISNFNIIGNSFCDIFDDLEDNITDKASEVTVNAHKHTEQIERKDLNEKFTQIKGQTEGPENSFSDLLNSWKDDDFEMEKNERSSLSVPGNKQKSSCDIDGELWSKGHGLSKDNNNIQPVTLLTTGKRQLSSADDQSPPSKKTKISEEKQKSTYDLFNSQPIKRSCSAFDLFTKDITSKVVAENPCGDVDFVSQIIEDKWSKLPASSKTQYELKAGSVNAQQKTSITPAKSVNKLKNRLKQRMSSSPSIKDQLLKSVSQQVPVRKIEFDLKNLQLMYSSQINSQVFKENQELRLIGSIKNCCAWTCCHGNQIQLLNPHRIQETVLYHKLLKSHQLPAQNLEVTQHLTEGRLGNTFWRSLVQIADSGYSSQHMNNYITDDRFISNGIKIRYCYDQAGALKAEVVGLCSFIPMYGIDDVIEVLELITNSKTNCIDKARPLKVLNYLKGEAVRMARQMPNRQSRDDVTELLEEGTRLLPKGCNSCLHSKPFYHTLYDLNDIPLTQTQT